MARQTTQVTRHQTELTHEDGRLVEVTVKAVGNDGELTLSELNAAFRELRNRLRQDQPQLATAPPQLTGPARRSLEKLRQAWEQADGKLTDHYLATVALTYSEGGLGRDAIQQLAYAIGKPSATVKGHVLRARKAGYLTASEPGRSGGKLTNTAREVLGEQLVLDDNQG